MLKLILNFLLLLSTAPSWTAQDVDKMVMMKWSKLTSVTVSQKQPMAHAGYFELPIPAYQYGLYIRIVASEFCDVKFSVEAHGKDYDPDVVFRGFRYHSGNKEDFFSLRTEHITFITHVNLAYIRANNPDCEVQVSISTGESLQPTPIVNYPQVYAHSGTVYSNVSGEDVLLQARGALFQSAKAQCGCGTTDVKYVANSGGCYSKGTSGNHWSGHCHGMFYCIKTPFIPGPVVPIPAPFPTPNH